MEPDPNNRSTAEPDGRVEEIDISLLEESLRLSPWQRLVENQRMLALVRMLEAAHGPDGATESNS